GDAREGTQVEAEEERQSGDDEDLLGVPMSRTRAVEDARESGGRTAHERQVVQARTARARSRDRQRGTERREHGSARRGGEVVARVAQEAAALGLEGEEAPRSGARQEGRVAEAPEGFALDQNG